MSIVDLAFVFFCAASGALGGYGIWTHLQPGPKPAANPAAQIDRPDRRKIPRGNAAQAAKDRSDPPVGKPPGGSGAATLVAAELQQQVERLVTLLETTEARRKEAEDRLLAEIRAVLTAEDPGIRERLDRISEALNIPSAPEGEADGNAASDASGKVVRSLGLTDEDGDDTMRELWEAEFSDSDADTPAEAGADGEDADAAPDLPARQSLPEPAGPGGVIAVMPDETPPDPQTEPEGDEVDDPADPVPEDVVTAAEDPDAESTPADTEAQVTEDAPEERIVRQISVP